VLAFVAAFFAAANVVGGYAVTGRMLKMFRRKAAPPVPAATGPVAVTPAPGIAAPGTQSAVTPAGPVSTAASNGHGAASAQAQPGNRA
jgi:NAD(P) transhydrogenase subunit alpha